MDEQREWLRSRRRKHFRIIAVLLIFCLLVTTYPNILEELSVLAQEEERYITGFEELPGEIREQTVSVGTPMKELELPDSLEVFAVAKESDEGNVGGEEDTENGGENSGGGEESTENGGENSGGGEEGTESGGENSGDSTGSENSGDGEAGTENGDDSTGSDEDADGVGNGGENTGGGEAGTENGDDSTGSEENTGDAESDGGDSADSGENTGDAGSDDLEVQSGSFVLPVYQAENEITVSRLEAIEGATQTAEDEAMPLTENAVQGQSETERITIKKVTWESTPAYDGEKAGVYVFVPVLPAAYTLAAGVSLPQIRVTVAEDGLAEGELPVTEEEWEAYLAGLDEETAAIVSSLEASNIQTFAAEGPGETRAVDADSFGERHKVRVVWINEKAIGSTALSSHCKQSYVCLRVPDQSGEKTMKFYFTKDILRDKSGKKTVLGEFTLPKGYEDGGDLFPTQVGMFSAISMLVGRPSGTVELQVYDYVEQEYRPCFSISLTSGGAVLGDILAEEEWVKVDTAPWLALKYGVMEGDASIRVETDRDVTKAFSVSLADNFGVALPRQAQDWQIEWILQDGEEWLLPDAYHVSVTKAALSGFTLKAGPEAYAINDNGSTLYVNGDAVYRGKDAGSCGFPIVVEADTARWTIKIQYAGGDGTYVHSEEKNYGGDYTIRDLRDFLKKDDPLAMLFDGTYKGTDGKTYRGGDIYKGNASLGLFPGWQEKTCKVTLDARYDYKGNLSDALAGNTPQTITMTVGRKYEKQAPLPQYAPKGFVFSGYFSEPKGGGNRYFDGTGQHCRSLDFSEDTTLYAGWRTPQVSYYLDMNLMPGAISAGMTIGGFVGTNLTGSPTISKYGKRLPTIENGEIWNKGYELLGWFSEPEGGYEITNDTPLPVGEAEYTFYAHWKPKECRMTYDPNGGAFEDGTVKSTTVAFGEPYGKALSEAPVPVREDCIFLGYGKYKGAEVYILPESMMYSEQDFTVYAVWLVGVTVNLDPTEGTLAAGQLPYVKSLVGRSVTLPVPVRSGYTFVCWDGGKDGQSQKKGNSHTFWIAQDAVSPITLKAVWDANTYQINFISNGGSGSMPKQSLTYDKSGVLPDCAYTRTGYAFAGWNTKADGSGISYGDGATVKNLTEISGGVVTLYAQWEPQQYTVSLDVNGGTLAAEEKEKTVTYGAAYGPLPEPVRDRYEFVGWYTAKTGGSQVTERTKVNRDQGHTLYAHWQYLYFTMTFGLAGGTGVAGEDFAQREMLKAGENLPGEKPAMDGWDFGGWSSTAGGAAAYQAGEKVACEKEAMTLYAVWTSDQPNVTYYANCEDSTVQNIPKGQLIDVKKGEVTLSAAKPVRTGYTFQGWAQTADGVVMELYQPGQKVKTVTSLKLYAVWEQVINTVTLTLQDDDGTVLSVTNYPKGTIFKMPSRPSLKGKTFWGWKQPGSQVLNQVGQVIKLDQDTVLEAYYTSGDVSECKYLTESFGIDVWQYGSLETANKKVKNGGQVVMLQDKSKADYIELSGTYTLDLNGKTLSPVKVSSGSLTICNGTLQGSGNSEKIQALNMGGEDCSAEVTLRDVTLNHLSTNATGILLEGSASLTLTGNTFIDSAETAGNFWPIAVCNSAQLTIEYAEIRHRNPILIQTSCKGARVEIRDGFFYNQSADDLNVNRNWAAVFVNNSDSTTSADIRITGGYFASNKAAALKDGHISGAGGINSKEYLINYRDSNTGTFSKDPIERAGEKATGVKPRNFSRDIYNDKAITWYRITDNTPQKREIWEVNGTKVTDMAPGNKDMIDGSNTFTLLDDHAESSTNVNWGRLHSWLAVDLSGYTYRVRGILQVTYGGAETGSLRNGVLKVLDARIAGTFIASDMVIKADEFTMYPNSTAVEAGARFYSKEEIRPTQRYFGDIVLLEQPVSDDSDYAHYYVATPWVASGLSAPAEKVNFHRNHPAAGGGASTDTEKKEVEQTWGAKWNVPANFTAPTGFVFYEYNTKADGSGSRITADAVYDKTVRDVYAVWKRKNMTITFDVNGGAWAGGGSTAVTRIVPYDYLIGNAPAAKRTGYTLKGWFTAKSGGTQLAEATAKAKQDQTYYARWEAATGTKYTVRCQVKGSTTLLDERDFYGKTGEKLSLAALQKTFTGYRYDSWDGASKTIAADGSTVVTLQYVLKSNAVKVTIKEETGGTETDMTGTMPGITISGGGSASATTSKNVVTKNGCTYGAAITLTAGEKAGYEFVGWKGAQTGTSKRLSFTMPDLALNEAVAVTAVYRKKTYPAAYDLTAVTASAQNGGEAPGSVTHGESLTVTLTAQSGYELPEAAEVTVTMAGKKLTLGESGTATYIRNDDNSGAVLTVQNVTGALSVTAAGVPKAYSVRFAEKSYAGGESGRIQAVLPDSVLHGQSCSVVLTVAKGYEPEDGIEVFVGVDEDGNGGVKLDSGAYRYDPMGGTVYIPAVTGNLLIKAGALPGQDTLYQAAFYQMEEDGTYGDTPYDTSYLTGETGARIDAAALAGGKRYSGFAYETYDWQTGAGDADSAEEPHIAADGSTVVRFYYRREQYAVTIKAPDGKGGWTDWSDGNGGGGRQRFYYRQSVSLDLPARTGYQITGWTAYAEESFGETPGQVLYSGMDKRFAVRMPANDLVVTPEYAPTSLHVSYAGLDHVSFDTEEPEAWYEQPFAIGIVAEDGYELPTQVQIAIGADKGPGVMLAAGDFTYDPVTGKIEITAKEKLTGAIEIRAEGTKAGQKVTLRYAQGVTAETVHLYLSREIGEHTVDYNGSFALVLTPESGYEKLEEDAVTVVAGDPGGSQGTPLTEGVYYDADTGMLSIVNIKKDILITIPAAKESAPQPVSYTVEHYRADGNGGYKLAASVYREAIPGTILTARQRDQEKKNYTGYTYNREKSGGDGEVEIAADGSTMVSLYYDHAEYELTIAIDAGLQGGVSGQPQIAGDASATYRYRYGESISLEIAGVDGGTSFTGWHIGGSPVTTGMYYTFTMPAEGVTMAAKSSVGSYELAAYGKHGTARIPDEEEAGYLSDIPYNTAKSITITPENTHYCLPQDVNVTVDGETAAKDAYTYTKEADGTNGRIDLQVLGDTAVEFAMVPESYEVTLDAMGGVLAQKKIPAVYGEPYGELPAPQKEGHVFLGWFDASENGTQAETGDALLHNSNHTLYARWQTETYEILLDAAGGEVEQTKLSAAYGQPYGELPVPERKGYQFVGWFDAPENGRQAETGKALLQNKDHTLYAQWKKESAKPSDKNKDSGKGSDQEPIAETLTEEAFQPIIQEIPSGQQGEPRPEPEGKAVMDGDRFVALSEDDERLEERAESGEKKNYSLDAGQISVEVNCPQDYLQAAIGDTAAVINSVLSPEQKKQAAAGETIRIRIDVTDISDSVPDQDKETIAGGMEACRQEKPGLVLGMYIDISMFIQIGDSDWNAVTETKEPVEVVINIPEELLSEGRTYGIIRAHQGVYTIMEDQDQVPETITISTDLFSSYAIVYEEMDAEEAEDRMCSLCHICPTFLGICYFIWLAVIVAVILFLLFICRRKKEEEEEKEADAGK